MSATTTSKVVTVDSDRDTDYLTVNDDDRATTIAVITAADIIASYDRIKDQDAETDLKNKFRALLYYHYMVDDTISDNDMKTVAAVTNSEFVCLLLARKGLEAAMTKSSNSSNSSNTVTNKRACSSHNFTDLALDNSRARIRSKNDLILAIQLFSQRTLNNYQFTIDDLDVLPYAIKHYNSLVIDKLLPFANTSGASNGSSSMLSLQVPDLQEFPRLQQEMSRFRRDVHWYRQTQAVQLINQQRLRSWTSRSMSIY